MSATLASGGQHPPASSSSADHPSGVTGAGGAAELGSRTPSPVTNPELDSEARRFLMQRNNYWYARRWRDHCEKKDREVTGLDGDELLTPKRRLARLDHEEDLLVRDERDRQCLLSRYRIRIPETPADLLSWRINRDPAIKKPGLPETAFGHRRKAPGAAGAGSGGGRGEAVGAGVGAGGGGGVLSEGDAPKLAPPTSNIGATASQAPLGCVGVSSDTTLKPTVVGKLPPIVTPRSVANKLCTTSAGLSPRNIRQGDESPSHSTDRRQLKEPERSLMPRKQGLRKAQTRLIWKVNGRSFEFQLPYSPNWRDALSRQLQDFASKIGVKAEKLDPKLLSVKDAHGTQLEPRSAGPQREQFPLSIKYAPQVYYYNSHMKKHFNRILEVAEVQFSDKRGRRKVASWNLAKPLTVAEIKQMTSVGVVG